MGAVAAAPPPPSPPTSGPAAPCSGTPPRPAAGSHVSACAMHWRAARALIGNASEGAAVTTPGDAGGRPATLGSAWPGAAQPSPAPPARMGSGSPAGTETYGPSSHSRLRAACSVHLTDCCPAAGRLRGPALVLSPPPVPRGLSPADHPPPPTASGGFTALPSSCSWRVARRGEAWRLS